MIDYYAAYSFYALLVIGLTVACIIVAAFLSAYMFARLSMNIQFFVWIAALISFLCLPVARFMVLVSPTVKLLNLYIHFQLHAAILCACILFAATFIMLYSGVYKKVFYGMAAVFIVHFICIFYLFKNSFRMFADFAAILDFAALTIFMVVSGPDLFPELSPVSLDGLMKRIDEVILIFGENGKLIDASRQAKVLFPFLKEGLPMAEFIDNIQKITISQQRLDIKDMIHTDKKGQIELFFADGEKCFQYCITHIKHGKRNSVAVVVSLHDTTENFILQKQLEQKNTELEKINYQLQEFLETEEKLIEEEQKAKAAKEIREEIGTKIEKLITEMQNVRPDEQQQKLPVLIERCRELMAGIRISVQKLMRSP